MKTLLEALGSDPETARRLIEAGEGPAETTQAIERLLEKPPRDFLPPLRLASSVEGVVPLDIDSGMLASELADEYSHLFRFLLPFAGGALLALAYESTKQFRDAGPVWEFLRHCRNAAAHNGRFHFLGSEPIRPAIWRGHTLLKSMHGTRLFWGSEEEPGLLRPADPVHILWDIEQGLPNLQ
jgi:hypothetical protein